MQKKAPLYWGISLLLIVKIGILSTTYATAQLNFITSKIVPKLYPTQKILHSALRGQSRHYKIAGNRTPARFISSVLASFEPNRDLNNIPTQEVRQILSSRQNQFKFQFLSGLGAGNLKDEIPHLEFLNQTPSSYEYEDSIAEEISHMDPEKFHVLTNMNYGYRSPNSKLVTIGEIDIIVFCKHTNTPLLVIEAKTRQSSEEVKPNVSFHAKNQLRRFQGFLELRQKLEEKDLWFRGKYGEAGFHNPYYWDTFNLHYLVILSHRKAPTAFNSRFIRDLLTETPTANF